MILPYKFSAARLLNSYVGEFVFMKKPDMAATLTAAVFAVSLLLLVMPDTVSEATGRALSLCAARVVPSVFPFSVLSSLIVAVGGASALDRALSPVSRVLFGSERGASALLLGMMFGFPLGALTVGAEYRAGALGRRESARLLAFVCCASPTFPVYAVGVGCFGSASVGVAIWLSQAAASVIIGVLLRGGAKRSAPAPSAGGGDVIPAPSVRRGDVIPAPSERGGDVIPAPSERGGDVIPAPPGAAALITRAITDASRVIVNVCGAVTFFSIMSAAASRLIGDLTDSPLPGLVISAVFEFSGGTAAAAEAYAAGEISRSAAVALAAFSVGFAGLSVMFQTASVCDGIPLLPHVCGKLATGAVTAIVSYFVSRLPSFQSVFYSPDELQTPAAFPFAFGLLSAAAVLSAVFIFYKRGCKNGRHGL